MITFDDNLSRDTKFDKQILQYYYYAYTNIFTQCQLSSNTWTMKSSSVK